MLLALQILLYLVLLCIAYMDFRTRTVQLLLLISLFVVDIVFVSTGNSISTAVRQFLINSVVVLLMVTILFVYYRVKEGSAGGFFNHKLGAGDLVFWLGIAPLFSLLNFILFLTGSLLLVLLIVLLQLAITKRTMLVPLAGWQALILLLVLLANNFLLKQDLSMDII